MIKINNIHKNFNSTKVLSGIDIEINQGEIIAIIGSSGTGKSTLLRCINFLETADQGEISIGDIHVDIPTASKSDILNIRRKTGFIFQNYALFSHLTAKENIAEALITVHKWKKKDALKKAQQILSEIGLSDKADNYPSSLSGGQQQRIGIGRAMALNAELLLFDEPTSALDPEWVNEVLSLMKKLAAQHQTMLVVTHEMQFAKEVADRVIYMADGKIVEQGTPDQVFNYPQDINLKKFLNKVGI